MRLPSRGSRAFFSYSGLFAILTVWWWIAFSPSTLERGEVSFDVRKSSPKLPCRHELLAALRGDWSTAKALLADWYIQRGQQSALFAEALALGEKVSQKKDGKMGLFAQTVGAATILFSLADPDEIVAIPRTFRTLALFPEEQTVQVPWDTEGCDGEKVAMMKPEIAFIAPYSNPTTVSMLDQLSIPLFRLPHLTNVSDTLQAIEDVGKVSGHGDEGRFLRLFVELALDQIDYCLGSFPRGKRVLYLSEMGQLSVPPKKSITADLLRRLGLYVKLGHEEWSMALSQEDIVSLHPDLIICSSFKPHAPYLWVDETIQHSPSQFIALAYLDIASTLLEGLQ